MSDKTRSTKSRRQIFLRRAKRIIKRVNQRWGRKFYKRMLDRARLLRARRNSRGFIGVILHDLRMK